MTCSDLHAIARELLRYRLDDPLVGGHIPWPLGASAFDGVHDLAFYSDTRILECFLALMAQSSNEVQ